MSSFAEAFGGLSTGAMIVAAGLSWAAYSKDRAATDLEPMLREYPGVLEVVEQPREPVMSARTDTALPGYVAQAAHDYHDARDDARRYDLFTGVALAVAFGTGLAAAADPWDEASMTRRPRVSNPYRNPLIRARRNERGGLDNVIWAYGNTIAEWMFVASSQEPGPTEAVAEADATYDEDALDQAVPDVS